MYKLFRSNQAYTSLAFLFIAGILLMTVAVFGDFSYKSSPGIFSDILRNTGKWTAFSMVLSTLFLGALFLNRLFVRFEFSKENHHFPGLLYILLIPALSAGSFNISLLLANLFLLVGLHKLLKVFRENMASALYFEAGFWLATAALFHYYYIFLFIGLITCIAYTRTFHIKEWFLAILGFSIPFLYAFSYQIFWANGSPVFALELSPPTLQNPVTLSWIHALALIYAFLGLHFYLDANKQSSNRSRNIKAEWLIVGLSILISAVFSYWKSQWTWESLALPTAILFSYCFTGFKKMRYRYIAFYTFIISCLAACMIYFDVTFSQHIFS